jgi:Tat protein secretion system quality control protein TatD with DNase activity
MEMKTKKYLTAGTYPKTNGKIVEMEKKNRYENQNYHTVGIHVVPKYIQKKQRQYRYLLRTLFYYCLLLRELFSYSVVW